MNKPLKKIISTVLLMILTVGTIPMNISNATFTTDDYPYPIKFVQVQDTSSGAVAIDEEGYLWAWGDSGVFGNAVNNTWSEKQVPTKVTEELKFTKIATSTYVSLLAIDEYGNLWQERQDDVNETDEIIERLVKIQTNVKFKDVEAGYETCFAIDENDNLWGWGDNSYGQVGDGTNTDYSTPVQIMKNVKQVATGRYSTLVIDKSGKLWFWGRWAESTYGPKDGTLIPTKILTDKTFTDISVGQIQFMAVDSLGNLWEWGGLLGGENVTSETARIVKTNINKVVHADYFDYVIVLDNAGTVWGRGDNYYGQLGNGTTTDSDIFVQSKTNVKTISTVKDHVLVLDNDGCVWGWGNNANHAIGNPVLSEIQYKYPTPIQITTIPNYYTVTFKNGTETLSTQTIIEGKSATEPNPLPTKEGYTLSWDTDFSNVTSDLTVNAVWIPNTNTEYKVEHYKQNASSNGYELVDTEQKTGTTGSMAVALSKTYEGFIENTSHSERVATGVVAGDGSLVLKLYYDRSIYTVTFKNGEEIVSTQSINYSSSATAPILTKAGYTLSWDKDFSNVTSNLTVNAIWTANTNTSYKVEHYLRTADMEVESYSLYETENKTGTTGEQVTATAKTYEGFTEDIAYEGRVVSGTIAGDGSLVLKLYYDRNTYNITYELNGGTATSNLTSTYIYGKQIVLSNRVEKEGYTFAGWYDNSSLTGNTVTSISEQETGNKTFYAKWIINEYTVTFKDGSKIEKTETVEYGAGATAPTLTKQGYTLSWDKEFNNVTSNLTVNAIWTANTNTAYKVEHYLRTADMEVESYSLHESENKTGTTGEQVTATAKTYTGFTENTTHSDRIISGAVAADGSLVLKLYYDRNTYNITYELNGGTATSTLTSTYLYGKQTVLSNRVEKEGYTFAGWYDNSSLTGTAVTSISEQETGNKTFYAKWVENDELTISTTKYTINEEESYITHVSPNTKLTAFLSNITTNGIAEVVNLNGNTISADDFVGTGYKLKVTLNGETKEYEIVVRGDIDGNGKITVTDLSMLNQHIVRRITLTGAREKAADIEYSGKITVTDLSMMNQALVGRIIL